MLRNSSSRLVSLLPLPGSVHLHTSDCCLSFKKLWLWRWARWRCMRAWPHLLWGSSAGARCQTIRPERRSAARLRKDLASPMKARVVLTNWHSDGTSYIKVTSDLVWCKEQTKPECKEDWEIPQSTNVTSGNQGVLQCCHGNGLKGLKWRSSSF